MYIKLHHCTPNNKHIGLLGLQCCTVVWECITSNNALATNDNLYTERELSLHGTSNRTTQLHVSLAYFDDIEDVSK